MTKISNSHIRKPFVDTEAKATERYVRGGHTCSGRIVTPFYPYPPQPPVRPLMGGQKCDLCGSTAIDHTEQQCSINRVLKPTKSAPKTNGKETK